MKTDFPEVKDKIIESVTLAVEHGFFSISIFLQDKTSLVFSIDSCVVAFPTYSEWIEGEQKIVKKYEPVRSDISDETEAGLQKS